MTSGDPLEEQAQVLAEDVAQSLAAFLGRGVGFEATRSGSRVVVANSSGPLTMTVGGRELLSCEVEYLCRFDHAGEFLAIHTSTVKVHGSSRPKGEPLFRYEYVYEQAPHLPSAHLHVHAHRDQFTHVMTLAAEGGAPHRQPSKADSLKVARMSTVHFPLGGHRFRPSLEDVLQMIHTEFGVDVGPGWENRLDAARLAFRRKQTRAAVRDCPSQAAEVLSSLGYRIQEPPSGPAEERANRLLAF